MRQSRAKKPNGLKNNPLFEGTKINEIMNKNALKMEKQLLNFLNLEETDESDVEDTLQKKAKLNSEMPYSIKQVGYVYNLPCEYLSLETL